MRGVNIVGFSNVGKTTLALELAEEFRRRGVNAGAVKCSHKERLDHGHRDSDRLLESFGGTVVAAHGETGIAWLERKPVQSLLPLLGREVIVVEGGKSFGWLPRILLLTDAKDAEQLGGELALAAFGSVGAPGMPHVQTVEELADMILSRGFILPGLDCGACGRANCRELCARIVAGEALPEECVADSGEVSIMVDGAALALNPFVSRMVAATIRAQVETLKGGANGRIEILVKPRRE